MSNPKMNPDRRVAIEFLAALGIVGLFLLVLSALFVNPVLGPLLVALIIILILGIVKRKRPELFDALKKPAASDLGLGSLPVDPQLHMDTHRAYLMLIGLNNSNQYRVTVNSTPFVIGNSAGCNFVVDDKYVSQRHLVIEYDANEKTRMITDISRNGTFLNGKRLQKGVRTALQHGDTLQIGGIIFSVEYVHF